MDAGLLDSMQTLRVKKKKKKKKTEAGGVAKKVRAGEGTSSEVKSEIIFRDTWSRRQAGAMRPVHIAGWVWAASGARAAQKLRGPGVRAQAHEARSCQELHPSKHETF